MQKYWILFFLVFALPIDAYTEVSTQRIRNKLNTLIRNSGIPRSNIGAWVGHKSEKIYSLNGERKFIPASVTKILPAFASLKTFSSSHQFKTRLYASGSVSGGVLDGNLYLVGGGDPSFTSETLWVLVNDFTREGITKVTGNIVVDDQMFDDVRFDPGRTETSGDRDRSYTAPVGAMSFNWNSVNIAVRPGSSRGSRPKVFVNPENDYIEVINQARTVGGSGKNISVTRLGLRFLDDGSPKDTIKVTGTIGVRASEFGAYRNITRPDYWTAANLKSFLAHRGIAVEGIIESGQKPSNARLLTSTSGKTVSAVISDMMKYSNNYLAEMLTKNLAYKANGQPRASMEEGLESIRKFLDEMGWERDNYVITSPSGLSRNNKFRPKDFHDLIEKLRKELVNFPEYLSAQAVGGIDGTLARRMRGTAAQGRLRAKTGTLTGVVGLVGFALRPDGEVIAFAFMHNGRSGTAQARRLLDRMAQALFL